MAIHGSDAAELHRLHSDGRHALVAAGPDGAPIGFADLAQKGHITFLYVDPDGASRGVGGALVADVLDQAQRQRVASVYSNAGEFA